MVSRPISIGKLQLTWLQVVTWFLWFSFIVGNMFLYTIANFLPPLLELLVLFVWLSMLVCEVGLAIRYYRWVGTWWAVISFWVLYSIFRIIAIWMDRWGIGIGVSISLLTFFYAMIAGLLSLLILAIRRDVSLTYFIIVFAVGGIFLSGQVLASGGILNWLETARESTGFEPFFASEPVFMALSCMILFMPVSFTIHFAKLLWAEYGRWSL